MLHYKIKINDISDFSNYFYNLCKNAGYIRVADIITYVDDILNLTKLSKDDYMKGWLSGVELSFSVMDGGYTFVNLPDPVNLMENYKYKYQYDPTIFSMVKYKFSTLEEANNVLNDVKAEAKKDGFVTVGKFLKIVSNILPTPDLYDHVWINVDCISIDTLTINGEEGYYIYFPKIEKVKEAAEIYGGSKN